MVSARRARLLAYCALVLCNFGGSGAENVQKRELSDAADNPSEYQLRGSKQYQSAWNVASALAAHHRHKKLVRGRSAGEAVVGTPKGNPMKIYAYPGKFKEQNLESFWTAAILDAAKRSKRWTTDASEAEVFLLGTEYACQLDWPAYTNDPPEANYKYGNKVDCPKQRNERLRAYLKHDAKQLHCDAPDAKQKQRVHIVFDMMGYTVVPEDMKQCKVPIIFAAPSFDFLYHRRNVDLGWPAPALISFDNPPRDVDCSTPPKYRVVFKGTLDAAVRKTLATLHNGKDVIVKLTEQKDNCHSAADVQKHLHKSRHAEVTSLHTCGSGEYKELLTNSAFGLVLRGDNLYSYRFLEVLSSGAIPVIFSDHWLLPFYEAVDYSKFAVVVREKDAENLLTILGKYSEDDVCNMRKAAKRAYRDHFANFDVKLETAVQVLERRKQGNTFPPPLDWEVECRKCDCC